MIAINDAVEKGHVGSTAKALKNPNALLTDLQEALMSIYQEMLRQAKGQKAERAASRVSCVCLCNLVSTCGCG